MGHMMHVVCCVCFFFFQAEDGIRDLVRSRGLGDVYKRQVFKTIIPRNVRLSEAPSFGQPINIYAPQSPGAIAVSYTHLTLPTSDLV